METFDFDTIVDRRGTDSLKYDFAFANGVSEDCLPLWVADMDFRTAPVVISRLERAARFGVFGYADTKDEYVQAVRGWFAAHFDWKPEASWLVKTPGVVFALAACVKAFTNEGDAVLIQRPVYHPFTSVVEENGRRVVNSPLVIRGGRYEMNLQDFEEKIEAENVRMFILCSPHNPVGRVWERETLEQVAAICARRGVTVVSDEIHCDFVWSGHQHTVFASISDEARDCCVVCTAPSKSFNLAGLQASNIFIPDPAKREAFQKVLSAAGYHEISQPGTIAAQAAYEEGGPWLDAVRAYIRDNLAYMETYIRDNIPRIRMTMPEGTYLAWLDLRELGMESGEQDRFVREKARLWLDTGTMFGPEGAGFERLNAACPRAILQEAMERLGAAVAAL